ncbi:MAG: sigma-70 family RNA polymerase sigma factor [candidate division NC10 bacterium]|nr:sigma-70 family RNA polymerase sigma factor [candidate division NC10 bacterium]
MRRREFEEVALVHLHVLYGAALRLAGNQAEAEDLVQETALRAYEFFHQFAPGTNCKAWLLRILYRTFLNRRRAVRLTVAYDDDLAPPVGGSATVGNPEEDFLRKATGEEIQRALMVLPEKFRLPVILADLEGLTYREIAEVCGCPVGTVMSRLHRGRAHLREALRELIEPGRSEEGA